MKAVGSIAFSLLVAAFCAVILSSLPAHACYICGQVDNGWTCFTTPINQGWDICVLGGPNHCTLYFHNSCGGGVCSPNCPAKPTDWRAKKDPSLSALIKYVSATPSLKVLYVHKGCSTGVILEKEMKARHITNYRIVWTDKSPDPPARVVAASLDMLK